MTFQKNGKSKKIDITYNGTRIEEVKEFQYLGTIIQKSGNFKQN